MSSEDEEPSVGCSANTRAKSTPPRKKAKPQYTQAFNQDWLQEKEFKSWLQADPGDKFNAVCRVCGITIKNCNRSLLLSHSSSITHSKNKDAKKDDNVLGWFITRTRREVTEPVVKEKVQPRPFARQVFPSKRSMDLGEVVKCLNGMAPTYLAESWDNVGLLVEPHTKREIKTMMLTNDLTEEVMEEAVQRDVNFILSYHPPVFRPLKKITSKSWKERIVSCCLEKGIAIYSPHTCYDALEGGVNDWLIQAFGGVSATPLQQSSKPPKYSHQVSVQNTEDGSARALLENPGQLNSLGCTFYTIADKSLIILCQEDQLTSVISIISKKNQLQFTISKLEQVPLVDHGMGRKCQLRSPITVKEAVNKIKSHLKLPHVRLALAHGASADSQIKSVAVCAGSGSSVLRGTSTDLWLTGEMSHHEVLDATHQGTTVILTDHSNTERGFLRYLQPRLVDLLQQKVQVIVSEKDRDPLEVV